MIMKTRSIGAIILTIGVILISAWYLLENPGGCVGFEKTINDRLDNLDRTCQMNGDCFEMGIGVCPSPCSICINRNNEIQSVYNLLGRYSKECPGKCARDCVPVGMLGCGCVDNTCMFTE